MKWIDLLPKLTAQSWSWRLEDKSFLQKLVSLRDSEVLPMLFWGTATIMEIGRQKVHIGENRGGMVEVSKHKQDAFYLFICTYSKWNMFMHVPSSKSGDSTNDSLAGCLYSICHQPISTWWSNMVQWEVTPFN